MVFFITFGALFAAFASVDKSDAAIAEDVRVEYAVSYGDSARLCETFSTYARPFTSDKAEIERLASGEMGVYSNRTSDVQPVSAEM